MDFEKHQLIDIHRQYGTNLRIFKFEKPLSLSCSSSTLIRNLDNFQNVFMMHTRPKSKIDCIANKEPISNRILYKVSFNTEKTRTDLITKLKFYNLTMFPDIELFVPFDDECELFLNNIFPTNRHHDNNKYTYLTVIGQHYMQVVPILETFYGLIQVVNSRQIARNVMSVNNREPVKNPRIITEMFLDNVPICDILVGRVYENEQCVEFHTIENEITFIIVKIYIRGGVHFLSLLNGKYQAPCSMDSVYNVITCENESELLTFFNNLYTSGLIFNVTNGNIHFIMASQRYKSNSYYLLDRILYNNLWTLFADHCCVSEDGKCIRFNRNSIVLFDSLDRSNNIVTNYEYIDKDSVYLPEVYCDSMVPASASDLQTHIINLRPNKVCKYVEVQKQLEAAKPVHIFSSYDMIKHLCNMEKDIPVVDYNLILESIIELSNKIRIPITLLYSLSVAQIAYRLIFYSNLRNGIFLLLDRDENIPSFYQTDNRERTINAIKTLQLAKPTKLYDNLPPACGATDEPAYMFQNFIKKFIPIHMTGNLVDNYFTFFCPGPTYFPLMASIVEDEHELMRFRSSITWSRERHVCGKSIVSYDFSLYNSSLISLFGLDLNNCAILTGFELKTFFYNIFPTPEHFNENRMSVLQLPNTFIMDSDTLRIHNITEFAHIDLLEDHHCYVLIMRFLVQHIMQANNSNYQPLAHIFYTNIQDMNKYKTRLALHKNILNAICGMLSAYRINTTLLNVVNALARKVILWTVDNCTNTLYQDDLVSTFIDHCYDLSSPHPSHLISIENDSFTFIFSPRRLVYEDMVSNQQICEEMRCLILQRLCSQLATCTPYDAEDIEQHMINLKLNFITGNLFQISQRKFYYMQPTPSGVRIVSNEHKIHKSLVFLNMDSSLLQTMRRGAVIRLNYLKRTYNFVDTRRLLIWYMIQVAIQQTKSNNYEQQNILTNLKTIDIFLNRPGPLEKQDIGQHLNLLFMVAHTMHVDEYLLKLLCLPVFNLDFRRMTIPAKSVYTSATNSSVLSIQLPNDKKLLVHNCVDLFFRLYNKASLK